MTSASRGTLESEVESDGPDPPTSNLRSLIDRTTVETSHWSWMLARPVRRESASCISVYRKWSVCLTGSERRLQLEPLDMSGC
jgi:hypothetical protein